MRTFLECSSTRHQQTGMILRPLFDQFMSFVNICSDLEGVKQKEDDASRGGRRIPFNGCVDAVTANVVVCFSMQPGLYELGPLKKHND